MTQSLPRPASASEQEQALREQVFAAVKDYLYPGFG